MKEIDTPDRQNQRRGYNGPSETAAVRTETIRRAIHTMTALSTKSSDRVNLHDLQAVKARVQQFEMACAESGLVPSLEGAAAMLGLSRRRIYQFLSDYPDDPTTVFFDIKRTEWSAIRLALSERGAIDATTAIFITLNSALNYTNEHKVEISQQPQNPLAITSEEAEQTRKRIMASIPDDLD